MVFILSGRVALQKAFVRLPCRWRHFCSMSILVIWQRDEYDITREIFRYFPNIYPYDC